MNLVTPISHLFADSEVGKRISSFSTSLEGRPDLFLPGVDWKGVTHVHFSEPSLDAHLPWGAAQKDIVRNAISKSGLYLETLSFHLSRDYLDFTLDRAGSFLPGGIALSENEMQLNCEANFRWLRNNFGGRILLENNNYFSTGAYEIVTNPHFIKSMVLNHADGLLFDLAHSAVAASNKSMSFVDYVTPLLETTVGQIHLSKWSVDSEGVARDTHDLPGERELKILEGLVSPSLIETVPLTIEFYKDAEMLTDLLRRMT